MNAMESLEHDIVEEELKKESGTLKVGEVPRGKPGPSDHLTDFPEDDVEVEEQEQKPGFTRDKTIEEARKERYDREAEEQNKKEQEKPVVLEFSEEYIHAKVQKLAEEEKACWGQLNAIMGAKQILLQMLNDWETAKSNSEVGTVGEE